VKTLGVDLAAQPFNTAICGLRWHDGRCTVEELQVGAGDDPIVRLAREADATGIDAPFGWPGPFVDAVRRWTDGEPWPIPLNRETSRSLRLRATDLWLQQQVGKWPLSVSSDTIAMCAMRAVTLLTQLGDVDRVAGPYYEVYPGAALKRWGIDAAGYKRERADRERVIRELAPPGGWLTVTDEQRAKLAETDHALDALVCALVARAAATRRTQPPPDELAEIAAREGWIHLPDEGSPAELARVST
jgi:predicted nuclease with RNAse H fold